MKKTMDNTVEKNKWITLFVVVAMTFMATLDSSIVNVTLPVMSDKLNVSLSSIEWVVAVYVIVISSTILLFGRIGDIFGKSRVFKFGSVIFILGSLLCGFSKGFLLLIIFRIVQAIGASAYMANNQGIITELFQKNNRGKALGILATAVALGTMIGPPVGGVISSILNYNYIFLVNVPIGIIIIVMEIKYLPVTKIIDEKLDIAGGLLQFFGISLFFVAFNLAQKVSFSNVYIIFCLSVSIVLLCLFFYTEYKRNQPLLDLKIFKNNLFCISLICALISFICISASSILVPFYFQDTMKLSASTTGFILMIAPIIVAICSPIFGTLSDKVGSEVLCFVGLILMTFAFLALSFLKVNSVIFIPIILLSLLSLGQSIFQSPNNSLIMSNCPKEKLGIAGSVNSLVRNLGQSFGISISTTFLYIFMSKKLNYRVSGYVFGKDYAFVYGMNKDYIILAAICLFGVIISGLRMYKKKS